MREKEAEILYVGYFSINKMLFTPLGMTFPS